LPCVEHIDKIDGQSLLAETLRALCINPSPHLEIYSFRHHRMLVWIHYKSLLFLSMDIRTNPDRKYPTRIRS
jgi:hypothetical protein